ncbi:MAG TPA: alpha/beta hydrolase [Microvirga sp.]|jgi:hypothetical protein|nr:alpha/beta hydrolase [Microvirga sp.]
MKRLLKGLALALVVLYAGVLAALFLGQRSLLYPGAGRDGPLAAAEANLAGFQDVTLTTPDGERLRGWWKPPEAGRVLVVYFHGNGGSLRNRRSRVEALAGQGRGVLLVSYRGYSGSTGSPTEAGLRIDARTAYGFAARAVEPARIALYGESLGTGVAVRLAAERPVGGLILDAPYTSTAEVAAGMYWYVPVAWLMHDQYRSIEIIDRVKAPILVMHGDRDRVIPFAYGERLFAAAPEPKRFLRLPGSGHTRNLESGGLAAVDAFLAEIETGLQDRPPPRAEARP